MDHDSFCIDHQLPEPDGRKNGENSLRVREGCVVKLCEIANLEWFQSQLNCKMSIYLMSYLFFESGIEYSAGVSISNSLEHQLC